MEFTRFEYNNYILKLFYKVNDFEFIEEINFNPNNLKLRELNDKKKQALNLAFTYLHLVAGISYYKLFLPEKIDVKTIKLSKEQANFFDTIYFKGLGEFACRNNLNLNDKIHFPYFENVENKGININLSNDIIVPIGGGKDSVVSLEILKKLKNQKLYTFSVNTAKPIQDCCNLSNCENILVNRKISPLLIEINKDLAKYNAYNGHVPISAIIAFISVCAGIIYNCSATAISNERSANIGNTIHNGVEVNHQWSKSFEAEKMIHDFIINYITPQFNYFSLLRPMSELQIAENFVKINKYKNVFASCNKNFKIVKNQEPQRWCCDCDKCRFVFLIFAPFFSKQEMLEIFGENLLNNEKHLDGYLELCGLSKYKPFECVGEVEESITAFYMLENTDFKNDFIVERILKEIHKKYSNKELEKIKKNYFAFDFNNNLLENKFKELYKEL